jgi:hypothetical protein
MTYIFYSALRNDFSHLAIAVLCFAARFFTTQKIFAHREIWEEMKAWAKKNRCMSTGFLFDPMTAQGCGVCTTH